MNDPVEALVSQLNDGRRLRGGWRRRALLGAWCLLLLGSVGVWLNGNRWRANEARTIERIRELGGETGTIATMVLLPGLAPDSIINQYVARLTTRDRLCSIELAGKPAVDEDLARFVDVYPHVFHLDVSGSQITDKSAVELVRFARLRSLIADDLGLTDASIVPLAGCEHLTIVELNGTHITDDSLAALARLPQLQRLCVAGTRVTDAGLLHLRQSKRLELLIVSNTRVTGAGAEALEAANPGCIVLR